MDVQIYIQLYGIAFTSAWTAVMTVVIFLIVDRCGGMRVPEVHEAIGLDIANHSETILAMPKKKLAELILKCEDASKQKGEMSEDLDLDTIHHGGEFYDDEVADEEASSIRSAQRKLGFDDDNAPAKPKRYRSVSILMDGSGNDDLDDI